MLVLLFLLIIVIKTNKVISTFTSCAATVLRYWRVLNPTLLAKRRNRINNFSTTQGTNPILCVFFWETITSNNFYGFYH